VAIRPPEILNRLPSVSELLDKPQVRALADRWNRSVVAGGVRSFLEDFKNDLRRRAAEVQVPSIRELAERAASYIISRQHESLGTAINATGLIWGEPWSNRPLSDAALERVANVGREFSIDPQGGGPKELGAALCRLTGAQGAVVVHSYSSAVWLTISTIAAERELIVARAEVGQLGAADSLPKLAASTSVTLRDVGTANRVTAADYEAAATPRAAAILTLNQDEYRIVGDTAAPEVEELVAMGRERELVTIAAIGTAPLIDPQVALPWPQPSARSLLAKGIDLVIVRGDGFIGGPDCGIILGRREIVERVAGHPLFAALRVDALRAAALAATLECGDEATSGVDAPPVWQLLDAPLENLRNRAERISPQLARGERIASALVVESRSAICPMAADGLCETVAIALTPREGSSSELQKWLRALPAPVYGRVEGDRVLLDLRTVLPRQDRVLVDSIVGSPTAEEESKPVQAGTTGQNGGMGPA